MLSLLSGASWRPQLSLLLTLCWPDMAPSSTILWIVHDRVARSWKPDKQTGEDPPSNTNSEVLSGNLQTEGLHMGSLDITYGFVFWWSPFIPLALGRQPCLILTLHLVEHLAWMSETYWRTEDEKDMGLDSVSCYWSPNKAEGETASPHSCFLFVLFPQCCVLLLLENLRLHWCAFGSDGLTNLLLCQWALTTLLRV